MLGRKTAKTFKTDLELLFAAKSTPLFKQQKGFHKKKKIFLEIITDAMNV